MSKPINENPNPAPRYPAPVIQIHPQNSRDATIARLTAEVERLRASRARLAEEVEVSRAYIARGMIRGVRDHLRERLDAARCDVNAHNDLAPPAKEFTDGH